VDIVEALGEIGDARAVEPLIAVVSDKSQEEPDASNVPFMMRWVDVETRDMVRRLAIDALARIGDQRAVPVLTGVLRDQRDCDRCREAAAQALDEIGRSVSGAEIRRN